MIITGNLVDILNRNIYPAEILIQDGRIKTITPNPQLQTPGSDAQPLNFILPGFVDAHVHIESSMLIPSQFARLSVVHGTVATVSDPHEIANVCGLSGVGYMIKDGKRVPFKFYFGAPSCVPATTFETAGAAINVRDVDNLMGRDEIKYLSEMMNFPGVLSGDYEVLEKIAIAGKYNKPVDGHAPGLMGEDARRYFASGISTDHECFTHEEALDKLGFGAKILIREGSAARNFEALIDLLNDHYDHIMFCSDDKHPDSLVSGHINLLCARAVAKGIDIYKVLQAACFNPVHHYKLDVGLLQEGDAADFIVVKDLEQFEVLQTYINGVIVAENGKTLIENDQWEDGRDVNNFNCPPKHPDDFAIKVATGASSSPIPVIEALDGQLITNKLFLHPKIENGEIISDVAQDVLKIVVVNRYHNAPVAKAFIKNFGLKRGAIASSVAHDSHNIVAVGVDDDSLCRAVNLVISSKGGVSCIDDTHEILLPLPVAGLMSSADGYKVAEQYTAIDTAAKSLGSTLSSPYMTLSFMALLVIPHLKLSDKGLFDGDNFQII